MTDDERDAAIDDWEEKAGVMQYDAGLPRLNAESMALRDVVARRGQEAGRAVQEWRKKRD